MPTTGESSLLSGGLLTVPARPSAAVVGLSTATVACPSVSRTFDHSGRTSGEVPLPTVGFISWCYSSAPTPKPCDSHPHLIGALRVLFSRPFRGFAGATRIEGKRSVGRLAATLRHTSPYASDYRHEYSDASALGVSRTPVFYLCKYSRSTSERRKIRRIQ